jgi:hypothetical protein
MSDNKALNVSALQRAAEQYDPTLRKLPFLVLTDTLDSMEINLLEVDGKDKVVMFHRKGSIARPYVVGGTNTVSEGEIAKAIERELEPKACFTALKDHIMNYSNKRVISNQSEKIDNKEKRHPQELLIIESKIRTVGEDMIDAMFFSKRDNDDKSPMGMFDGFNELIDKEIVAGEVAAAKGNLFATGAITGPGEDDTDTEAFNKLIGFIRSASPFLRRKGVLYITNDTLFNCMDALGNKLKYKNAMEFEVFVEHLRGLTQAPALRIITHEALGSGSRLLYTVPRNLDLGVGTKGEESFVQVRDPYEDPNIVQFWMQWTAGGRVTSIHPKEFLVNDQTNTSTELSGDYS